MTGRERMAYEGVLAQFDYRIAPERLCDPEPSGDSGRAAAMQRRTRRASAPGKHTVVYVHEGRCVHEQGQQHDILEAGSVLLLSGDRHGTGRLAAETPSGGGNDTFVTAVQFDPAAMQPLLKQLGPVDALQLFEERSLGKQVLPAEAQEEMELLLERLERLRSGDPGPLRQGRLLAALADLLLFICERSQDAPHAERTPPTEKEKVVREVIAFIEARYMDDLSMERLETHIHLSKYYMMKLFKELTGMTIFHYLNHFRINQAKVLIFTHQELSITEIGYQVGFKQPSHFSRNFKEIVGLSPEQYRRLV
ncbi:helix-turn-helix transcriptional regulator [Paenibacillus sp. MBLB4367]|uniref:helix-turn-helix transcriptional regulator n=1 Tax=Paenibacillus sp. MBLB4367 TaxID=3384767 RepID=UPI003908254A